MSTVRRDYERGSSRDDQSATDPSPLLLAPSWTSGPQCEKQEESLPPPPPPGYRRSWSICSFMSSIDWGDPGQWKAGSFFPSSVPSGPQEELSHGKLFRCWVSWEKLSWELFLLCGRVIFLPGQPFLPWEKRLECLHLFGFYWENSDFAGRNWISVHGLSLFWYHVVYNLKINSYFIYGVVGKEEE